MINIKTIHYLGFIVIFCLAGIDAYQERSDVMNIELIDVLYIFIIPLFAISPAMLIYMASIKIKLNKRILFTSSYLVLLSGIAAWFGYVLSGQSNPNGAGHMHVIIFPIIHLLLAIIFLSISTLSALVLRKISNKSVKQTD